MLLDLTAAFDTVDHSILTSPLEHGGIKGALLDWFSSFIKLHYYIWGLYLTAMWPLKNSWAQLYSGLSSNWGFYLRWDHFYLLKTLNGRSTFSWRPTWIIVTPYMLELVGPAWQDCSWSRKLQLVFWHKLKDIYRPNNHIYAGPSL